MQRASIEFEASQEREENQPLTPCQQATRVARMNQRVAAALLLLLGFGALSVDAARVKATAHKMAPRSKNTTSTGLGPVKNNKPLIGIMTQPCECVGMREGWISLLHLTCPDHVVPKLTCRLRLPRKVSPWA